MHIKPAQDEHAIQNSKDSHSLPNGFFVDQATGRRLEELCREMTNSCGMIECTLQLSLERGGEKRTSIINSALQLAARATRSLKLFLSEWGVITEESEVERARRAALFTLEEVVSLTEIERRSAILAMEIAGGDKDAASRLLCMDRTTLNHKLKEHELETQVSPERPEIAAGNSG